jgi:hypothetical protein
MRWDFLDHAGDLKPRLLYDFAGIRFHLTGQYLQKRALALAITTHKANAVASLNIERDIIQKRRTAKTQQNILNRQNGHKNLLLFHKNKNLAFKTFNANFKKKEMPLII